MAKYKFHINPKPPAEEQVNRHKDFKKLVYNYQRMTKPLYKKPLYKDKKAFLILLLILLIAYLVAEFSEQEKKTNEKDKTEQTDGK
jgi:hypothetical protein